MCADQMLSREQVIEMVGISEEEFNELVENELLPLDMSDGETDIPAGLMEAWFRGRASEVYLNRQRCMDRTLDLAECL